jgi:putative SOS response-associated peptidase YedK
MMISELSLSTRTGRSPSSPGSGPRGRPPKLAEGEVTADLFGFLTTDANREVGTVHPKAMPVILTREEELETWLAAPWREAARLQRPLPDGSLRIVARGERKDELAAVEVAP